MQVINPRSSQGLTGGKKPSVGRRWSLWVEDLEFYFYPCAELQNHLFFRFKYSNLFLVEYLLSSPQNRTSRILKDLGYRYFLLV